MSGSLVVRARNGCVLAYDTPAVSYRIQKPRQLCGSTLGYTRYSLKRNGAVFGASLTASRTPRNPHNGEERFPLAKPPRKEGLEGHIPRFP